MSITLRSITKSARKRAEDADPHSQRCLVENCSRTQAVQMAHVYDRNTTAASDVAESLEWGWGMMRGTLNLDTRHNIFFVGAYLHELYKLKKWLLLPEEDIVFKYFDEGRLLPLTRAKFPQIQSDTFRYRFLPLQDMEDVYITHQSNEGPRKRVDIHHYPFEDLPVITSHIHPKFVILHLHETIPSLQDSVQDALLERYPWFEDLQDLCRTWNAILPDDFSGDPTFKRPSLPNSQRSSARSESSGDSVCTPLRRIRHIHGQTPDPSLRHSLASDSSSSEGYSAPQHQVVEQSRKRRRSEELHDPEQPDKKRILTASALKMQEENDDLKAARWTTERISGWVEGCPAPPSPSPSPPPVLTRHSKDHAPLRRSARLKSKLKRV